MPIGPRSTVLLASAAFGWTVPALHAEPAPASAPATPAPSLDAATSQSGTRESAKRLDEFGEKFVLSASIRNENVDTEEYFLDGENPATWTQMLAYQRVSLAGPVAADEYVGRLKAHLEREVEGPRMRIVRQQKGASIFAVQYPKTANAPAQVTLALATITNGAKPNEIHVVQFTMNPERLPLGTMENLMKRWQARFEAKANALKP